jgi:pimeloyl-ACP methyl ester carboxylesterase
MSADTGAHVGARYEDRYFTVPDGLRLHYRDYPGSADRPPLLCLPGLTRNSRDFAALAERYSPQFRVLALEFRGRADSDHDPQPMRYNPLTYAGDVIELLGQLEIPQAIFIGTSLGGLVTMTVAATAPQRIAASILNDIGPELTNAGIDRIRSYVGKDVRFKSWEEAADRIANNVGRVPASYGQADWVRMARRVCREEDGEIRFDYDMAIVVPFEAAPAPTVDMWPLFAALAQKPLLVVRGELSDLLSADAAAKMQAAAPQAQFAIVPRVGHAPELDEPEAVAAIDAFLEGLSA